MVSIKKIQPKFSENVQRMFSRALKYALATLPKRSKSSDSRSKQCNSLGPLSMMVSVTVSVRQMKYTSLCNYSNEVAFISHNKASSPEGNTRLNKQGYCARSVLTVLE